MLEYNSILEYNCDGPDVCENSAVMNTECNIDLVAYYATSYAICVPSTPELLLSQGIDVNTTADALHKACLDCTLLDRF